MSVRISSFNWHQRSKAAAIHGIFSLCVGLSLLALLFFGWYPGVLMQSMGVAHIVLILMGVDLALGPMLTFAVFNPAKKSLKMDLAIIVMVQMAGLAYGLHTIYQGRPAWIVFVQDRFEVTRPADVDAEYLQGTQVPALWYKPVWAATPLMDQQTKDEYFTKMLKGEPDVGQRVNIFQPLPDLYAEVRNIAHPIAALRALNNDKSVDEIITQYPDHKLWLPLQTLEDSQIVLLPATNQENPVILPLKPW